MIVSPFGKPLVALDEDARKDVTKAVAIAGLSTLVTEGIKLGFEELKAWIARRRASVEHVNRDRGAL